MKGFIEKATPKLLLVYGLSLLASSVLIRILWGGDLFEDMVNYFLVCMVVPGLGVVMLVAALIMFLAIRSGGRYEAGLQEGRGARGTGITKTTEQPTHKFYGRLFLGIGLLWAVLLLALTGNPIGFVLLLLMYVFYGIYKGFREGFEISLVGGGP